MKSFTSLLIVVCALSLILAACGEAVEVISYYAPGDSIVINIAESYRLLKMAPVLVLNRDIEESEFNADMVAITPLIRDTINNIMRYKTEDELKSTGIFDQLRVEIGDALRNGMGMDYVTNVYFSDFVVQ